MSHERADYVALGHGRTRLLFIVSGETLWAAARSGIASCSLHRSEVEALHAVAVTDDPSARFEKAEFMLQRGREGATLYLGALTLTLSRDDIAALAAFAGRVLVDWLAPEPVAAARVTVWPNSLVKGV